MITRFQGQDGKKRLITALLEQKIINGDEKIAKIIADNGELKQFEIDENLILQDGHDSEIFFIISGTVDIVVNGRCVATRSNGTHVGEMALIDPTAKRSATVKATEVTVTIQLPEAVYSDLANENPKLWRRVAVELAARLRERGKYHRPPNEKPMVFIGSSSESLAIADNVRDEILSDDIVVRLWTDGIFEASSTTIESLASVIEIYDFGIIVLSADDITESRGSQKYSPRDNTIFELGLLMGGFGRFRTYIIKPKGLDIKIPSDLLGVTTLSIDLNNKKTTRESLTLIGNQLRAKFSSIGPR